MDALRLDLTVEEKELLVRLLRTELGETRTELHRTHFSPDFRQDVKNEEMLLRRLLDKLGAQPVETA